MATSPVADAQPGTTTDQPIALPNDEQTVSRFRRTFAAVFAYPVFRRLWIASLAASLGQWMQSTALGWLALELTNSKSYVGLVAFASGLPFLIVSIPGGALIDRYDRRKVLMTCQGLAACLAVIVAIDVVGGWVQPWHLLVAGFCNGSLQAILNPTQQSLVPGLVERGDLTNALGLMGAGSNMTRVVGPSIAGAIIAFGGTGEAFIAQAIALLIALLLVARLTIPRGAASTAAMTIGTVLSGIRLVARRADLRELFLMASIPTFFVFPYISFLSVFARDILEIGPEGLGLLMATSGIGAVFGSLMVASSRRRSHLGRTLVVRTVGYSLTIALFAWSTQLWFSLPLLVLAGLLGSNFMSMNNVLVQHRITDDVRGRVMSTYMLTWGLMPAGALPMGIIAESIGIQATTVIGAAITIGLTLILAWRSRALFTM